MTNENNSNIFNLESIPEDIREVVKEDIKKYGANAVYWMLRMAPLQKMIAVKSDKDNPEIWFQMAAHVLFQLASKDIIPPHSIVAREVLSDCEGGESENQDLETVNMLAVETLKQCQHLKKLILGDTNPFEDNKGFIIESPQEGHLFNIETLTKTKMLWNDSILLEHVSKIGKHGKKLAKELTPIYQLRFAKSLQEKDPKTTWNVWVGQKETFTPQFLSILAKICWKDVVKPKIENLKKSQKKQTFRQSREIIDNKLDRETENEQLTFNDLINNQEGKIKDLSTEKPIIKGLDLDQAEDRILQTLSLLLYKKSENKNQKSNNYYMGNYEPGVITINNIEMETARMTLSPHEFYSTYFGRTDYGADQISFLLKKLDSFAKKQYLTTWTFLAKPKPKEKEKRYDKFRTYCPLFQIALLNHDLSESESQEIDNNKFLLEGKNCLFLFKFQPQFTNNIRERYVEFPEDIYLRISETVGSKRMPQCVHLMRDFLFREKQQARNKPERYLVLRDRETIIRILKLDKFWKEGRRKKVIEMIKECFEIFQNIGLILEWKETQGALSQVQYRIQINPDFK